MLTKSLLVLLNGIATGMNRLSQFNFQMMQPLK